MQHKSPCLTCVRVKEPQKCENKACRDWQTWFIGRWEAMRESVRKDRAAAQLQEHGVPLGGERYAPPHRVREYLQTDPCSVCPCGSCAVPCIVRTTWEEKKGV